MGSLRFGRLVVQTTNEDKIFFPGDGITKGDVIGYHVAAADRMLPHLKGRPLTFQRFPNGIEGHGFFQKDTPDHYPDWISTTPVRKKGGRNCQVIADKTATLAYLANNGVLTIHGALSREPDLRTPDRLIFDLDPSVEDFGRVRAGAEAVRSVLDDLGLASFLQTTGSRGLHVVAPIRPERDFEEVGAFAKAAAARVVDLDPDAFTIEHRKAKRGDRLLIDYFRNEYAQTAVVPYSVRAKPGAPVAMPIEWHELDDLKRGAASFTIKNAVERLSGHSDPWRSLARRSRSLTKPLQRISR